MVTKEQIVGFSSNMIAGIFGGLIVALVVQGVSIWRIIILTVGLLVIAFGGLILIDWIVKKRF